MSRHNAQLRAAAPAYENAEPDYGDDELWEQAQAEMAGSSDAADAFALLTDSAAETAIYRALNGFALDFCDRATLTKLLDASRCGQAALQLRYGELIANGGRP